MNECKSRFYEIVLRFDFLFVIDYIDLMIEVEKLEKKFGYQNWIKMLYKFRESVFVDEKFGVFDNYLKLIKKDMEIYGILINFLSKNEIILEKGGCLFKKLNLFQFFRKFFCLKVKKLLLKIGI